MSGNSQRRQQLGLPAGSGVTLAEARAGKYRLRITSERDDSGPFLDAARPGILAADVTKEVFQFSHPETLQEVREKVNAEFRRDVVDKVRAWNDGSRGERRGR